MSRGLRQAALVTLRDCLQVKDGELVLIVYDKGTSEIADSLWATGEEMGARMMAAKIQPAANDGAEPEPPVAEAMKAADVVLCPTSRSLTHTAARRNATATGARLATLPGVTVDMMERTMSADYGAIAQRTEAVARILSKGEWVRVVSPGGTDLTMQIGGREVGADTGMLGEPGAFGNLPAGEAALAPVEGSTHGTMVIDGSMSGVPELDEPIRVTIEDGMATRISGGEGAACLVRLLEPIGDKAYNIAELGVGTNDAARITNRVLEDEKVLGTVHIALGNNMSMGGSVDVPVHLDGVILNPTVIIDDGTVLLDNGRLLVG